MSNKLKNGDWPWHIGGVLMGLVVTFAFITGKTVGTSTTYERITGHIISFFSPEYVAATTHYYKEAAPIAEWQVMFVIGLILAGVIGRFFFVGAKGEEIPLMWAENFGGNKKKRFFQAFLGGFLLLFGARIAGGCTSGLFISGGSQLALAAFVFAAGMFASGIITAKLLYKGRGL